MESEPFHTDCLGKPFASDKMTETNPFHSIRIFHWFAYERLSLCNVEATQVNIGICMQREVAIVINSQRSTGLYCLQATAGRQGQSWPEGRLSGEKKPPSQGLLLLSQSASQPASHWFQLKPVCLLGAPPARGAAPCFTNLCYNNPYRSCANLNSKLEGQLTLTMYSSHFPRPRRYDAVLVWFGRAVAGNVNDLLVDWAGRQPGR